MLDTQDPETLSPLDHAATIVSLSKEIAELDEEIADLKEYLKALPQSDDLAEKKRRRKELKLDREAAIRNAGKQLSLWG